MTPYLGWTRHRFAEDIKRLGWGMVWVSGQTSGLPKSEDKWFYDNGAFRDWRHGKQFQEDRFFRDMDRLPENCDFGLLPDRVGEGQASLDLSMSYIDRVRGDWPWLLPIQDGMTIDAVTVALDFVDGLFLGGTDKFKPRAGEFSKLCHANHKHFHYGRAGTLRKVRAARHAGAHSLDSSFPLWTAERFKRFTKWMTTPDTQTDWIENARSAAARVTTPPNGST